MAADVRSGEDCRRALDSTLAAFGRVDLLFNNAGVFFHNDVIDCSEEGWDEQIESSLKGTFLMSKFTLPSMIDRGSGAIVNNSSGGPWADPSAA